MRWPAPAKINRFLHVTGRRPDGYHELSTLFQLLDWGDELEIAVTADGAVRRPGASYAVAEEEDLVVRAARALQRAAGVARGAEIRVHKCVPMGSGLGGGSSDAATVLLVLNRLWGCGLSLDRLAGLGAALGADVPVFVRGRTALASGIGEQLQPVALGERHYVLVFPGLEIPTAELFAAPDLRRDSPPLGLGEALAGEGRNDFEPVALARYPALRDAMQRLQQWGRPRLTGTGSALFLEMGGEEAAQRAAREMKNLYNVRAVRGVDRSTLHEMLETQGQ